MNENMLPLVFFSGMFVAYFTVLFAYWLVRVGEEKP